MEFGKLDNIEAVDFTLPPDPPQNAAACRQFPPRPHAPRLYVGATGYNMKQWVGKWYPAQAKERDFLRCYGEQFATIEHNTTHYRIPDEATVRKWLEETPDDFRFCPKIPQTLSHARDLGAHTIAFRTFVEQMQALRPKIGSCFLQLPPYFAPQQLPVLAQFLERWPGDIPLSAEVRHEDFFKESPQGERFFQLLQSYGVSALITDVAGRRDVCHMRLTTPQTLVRFVGNSLHASDYTRVKDWAARLRAWFDAGLREAYFFTHEPDNLLAPELAVFAEAIFKAEIPEVVVRGPKEIKPAAIQGSLF